jgi:hypothetical protein
MHGPPLDDGVPTNWDAAFDGAGDPPSGMSKFGVPLPKSPQPVLHDLIVTHCGAVSAVCAAPELLFSVPLTLTPPPGPVPPPEKGFCTAAFAHAARARAPKIDH